MVIWLEDLTDDDPREAALEAEAARLAAEVLDEDAARELAGDLAPDEERVIDVTDDAMAPEDVPSTAAAVADDEGFALTDLAAARFTRH